METPPPLIPATPPEPPTPRIPESDRSWCIGLHLSGLAGIVLSVTLAHIVAPLVIWLIKRSESPVIDATGKEVLNFQISYTLYVAVAGLLCFVVIGFLIVPALLILWLVFIIIAAVKTSNGEEYHYPGTIRFLR